MLEEVRRQYPESLVCLRTVEAVLHDEQTRASKDDHELDCEIAHSACAMIHAAAGSRPAWSHDKTRKHSSSNANEMLSCKSVCPLSSTVGYAPRTGCDFSDCFTVTDLETPWRTESSAPTSSRRLVLRKMCCGLRRYIIIGLIELGLVGGQERPRMADTATGSCAGERRSILRLYVSFRCEASSTIHVEAKHPLFSPWHDMGNFGEDRTFLPCCICPVHLTRQE
ncbi:hypothetical protein EJ03DRAFT_133462 [Teratosphaeria nubilosa]|uniref:Uncharacterized protein n=1 Tax=Teratosphaeria nubilosa TaxID=161662 RepID=A0A6G1L687_9PEZI|nr:hypothetical protein EJ03DRAFT_133462 [Teratosphaeria nubilosa]